MVAVVHSSVDLSSVFAQNAETHHSVSVTVCQDPLDSVPRSCQHGRSDWPVQYHQVKCGEASCVPRIVIDRTLHYIHNENGSTQRISTEEVNVYLK